MKWIPAIALIAITCYALHVRKVARLEAVTDALMREAFRPYRDDLVARIRDEREEEANQHGSYRGVLR